MTRRYSSSLHCPYKILGVPSTISQTNLKKHYLNQVLKLHPDRPSTLSKEDANKEFLKMMEAYRRISTVEARKLHDSAARFNDSTASSNPNYTQTGSKNQRRTSYYSEQDPFGSYDIMIKYHEMLRTHPGKPRYSNTSVILLILAVGLGAGLGGVMRVSQSREFILAASPRVEEIKESDSTLDFEGRMMEDKSN